MTRLRWDDLSHSLTFKFKSSHFELCRSRPGGLPFIHLSHFSLLLGIFIPYLHLHDRRGTSLLLNLHHIPPPLRTHHSQYTVPHCPPPHPVLSPSYVFITISWDLHSLFRISSTFSPSLCIIWAFVGFVPLSPLVHHPQPVIVYARLSPRLNSHFSFTKSGKTFDYVACPSRFRLVLISFNCSMFYSIPNPTYLQASSFVRTHLANPSTRRSSTLNS